MIFFTQLLGSTYGDVLMYPYYDPLLEIENEIKRVLEELRRMEERIRLEIARARQLLQHARRVALLYGGRRYLPSGYEIWYRSPNLYYYERYQHQAWYHPTAAHHLDNFSAVPSRYSPYSPR